MYSTSKATFIVRIVFNLRFYWTALKLTKFHCYKMPQGIYRTLKDTLYTQSYMLAEINMLFSFNY